MQKVIFHMDGDSFFVGVEIAKNPKLRGLPVVTGEERGIASALSYEAKALGLTRGYPIYKIKKEFPQVLVLPGDYQSYAKYSAMMFDIVRRYIDTVEEYSIDECFGDLTGLDKPLYMSYEQIARKIKEEINKELDLGISVGVAPTKVLAKVASKWQKPNGFTIIEKDKIGEFLPKVPIEKIWGIGRRTSLFLKNKNINTAEDFAKSDIKWIEKNMAKPYQIIWHELNGTLVLKVDDTPKNSYSSIQKTRTFHPPTNDKDFLLSQFSKNIEAACTKARYYKLVPKILSFFLKTQQFKYFFYSIPIEPPTNAPEILSSLIGKFFKKVYREGVLYRTTGVMLQDLTPASATQMDLFGESNLSKKFEIIHDQIDSLQNKFGKNVVYLASTHKALKSKFKSKTKNEATDYEDLDRDLLFL